MSLTTRDGQSSYLARGIQALWRLLTSIELLIGAGVVLFLCLLAVLALPGLRTALAHGWEPGTTYAFWETLHPAAAWVLRILLALAALLGLVHLGDLLWPGLPATSIPLVLTESHDAEAREILWERLLATLTRSGWAVSPTRTGSQDRQAIVARPLLQRMSPASLYLGLLLFVLALSVLWRDGWVSASPTLVLGETISVAQPVSWRVALQEVELLYETEQALELAAAQLWVNDGAVARGNVQLASGHVTRHRGLWVSFAQALPAARIVALDETGAGLELYPMVGSRPASLLQRVAFARQEEHLFALPDAHLLIRSLFVGENAGACCIQVQVLDGLEGDLQGEVFLSGPTDLHVGDITVQVVPELAVVLALWHTPGIGLAAFALLLVIGGALGHRIMPPRRLGVGMVQAPEQDRWILYMAAPPQALRSDWCKLLRQQLVTEMA